MKLRKIWRDLGKTTRVPFSTCRLLKKPGQEGTRSSQQYGIRAGCQLPEFHRLSCKPEFIARQARGERDLASSQRETIRSFLEAPAGMDCKSQGPNCRSCHRRPQLDLVLQTRYQRRRHNGPRTGGLWCSGLKRLPGNNRCIRWALARNRPNRSYGKHRGCRHHDRY